MKGQKLLDAMEQIDDKYVVEQIAAKKKSSFVKLALAACFLLACTLGVTAMLNTQAPLSTSSTPEQPFVSDENLAILDIDDASRASGGMGFEGFWAKDIKELVNNNPWNEDVHLQYLPVYRNARYNEKEDNYFKPNLDEMSSQLLEVARRLGISEAQLIIKEDYPDEETIKAVEQKYAEGGEKPPLEFYGASTVSLTTGGLRLVNNNNYITIYFDPAVALPSNYKWGHYVSYNEVKKVSQYLAKQYANLIDMQYPTANIYGGGYNIYSQQGYSLDFYDKSGTIIDQIINYNFNKVSFACDDDNALFISRVFQPDLSHKIGDYPVISAEQAKELLLNGNYVTTVPYEMTTKNNIKSVELVYRNNSNDKIHMPYYRFLVDIKSVDDMIPIDGLNHYGAYYVPAIDGKYLANMPVWDGHFN